MRRTFIEIGEEAKMKKLLYLLTLSSFLLSSTFLAPGAQAATKLKVGIAYDIGGPGDKSLNDSASAGLTRSKKAFSIPTVEVTATVGTPAERETRLRFLLAQGCNPIIVIGYRYAETLKKIAAENPNVSFAIVNNATVDLLNVASLVFGTNQSAYLAGAAASLASKTGKIGYIGSANPPAFDSQESGFVAGVKATNSNASLSIKYLQNPSSFSGYSDPTEAKAVATAMIASGVDVIYSAADGSTAGTLAAITGKKAWMIGSDSDQYLMASASQRKNILSSTIKRVDIAVYDFISTSVQGSTVNDVLDSQAGIYGRLYNLKASGVELAYSGGFLNSYKKKLNTIKSGIASGKIVVPTDGFVK